MTSPQETADSQFGALKSRFERLFDEVNFLPIMRELSQVSERVEGLPDAVASIRSRGYAFASFLEDKVRVLGERWNEARRSVDLSIRDEINILRLDLNEAERAIQRGDTLIGKPALATALPAIESSINDLERKARAAETRLRERFTTLERDIDGTYTQVNKIKKYLDHKDAASFPFLASESLFIADEAEWVASGKSSADPDGILYLTDQRLIFEQKETTGKTLGLFGGKKVQELEWALPLNQVGTATPENKGLLGGKDLVHLKLMSGAPYSDITVEIKGGVAAKFWAAQIMRMIRGQVKDERAVEIDAETAEALRSAPTECPVCGATLPALTEGLRQINCPYCGALIRA